MYKQLTSEQRYTISVLLQRKCSKKSIAEAIGVHPSTVTRELKRNSSQRGVYKWDWAQNRADKRSRRQPGNRAIKVMGIDHVGLGTDFDGDGGVPGLANASELTLFTRQLLQHRYSERDIQKIWGGNFLRVMGQVQRMKE